MELIDKADILFRMWEDKLDDPAWLSFIEYNDDGLHLAFYIHMGYIVEMTEEAEQYIHDSYAMLCDVLKVSHDKPYLSWEEMWNDADWSEDENA